jgi:DNA replication protein DnaC
VKENDVLTRPTLEKLNEMRLFGMAKAWEAQRDDPGAAGLAFDERLALLVDAEHLARQNRRTATRLREAKLRNTRACMEDLDTGPKRGLERALARQLATCHWVEQKQNILVTGPTGTGKTFVACALGQQACRKGYKTLYRRVPRLLDEMALARADGSYGTLLARLARTDVLVLDDWGIPTLNDAQRRDMLEILEDRYGERATVISSQLPVPSWYDVIGDPTMADAILDRVIHNAYKIALKGESRRKGKEASEEE